MKTARTVAIVMFMCCVFLKMSNNAHAELSFSTPNINADGAVLFSMHDSLNAPYESIATVDLTAENPPSSLQMITYYPEQMELLSDRAYLQLRNKYGIARYDISRHSISWTRKNWLKDKNTAFDFTSHSSRYEVSPDGKWLCRMQKIAAATSDLIIEDASTGNTQVLVHGIPFSNDSLPVKWSPDGSVLFYEKYGNIYFLNPQALFRNVETNEQNRRIGSGKINSISIAGKYVFYIDGDCVYRIGLRELYTLGLFSEIIGTGTAVGRLSDVFVPEKDYFSVNETASSLVVVRNGKKITAYDLPLVGGYYLPITCYSPYTSAVGSVAASKVFWGHDGKPNLWFKLMPYDGSNPVAAVVKIADSGISETASLQSAIPPVVSPDKAYAIVFANDTLAVYNTTTWQTVRHFTSEKAVSAVWYSPNLIYIGGEYTVSRWDIENNSSEPIFLSSASKFSWNDDIPIAMINTSTSEKQFIYNQATGTWKATNISMPNTVIQNGRYRVYTGDAINRNYSNTIFYRTLTGSAATQTIFPESMTNIGENRRQRVALLFDAYASTDGLPHVLSALNTYKVPATFFLNGEFIKRYPNETKQIAQSPYTAASLFFTEVDLTSNHFNADEQFVRRGLARNEDVFFHTTGAELALLWHAPHFKATQEIKAAASKAGYRYVDSVTYQHDEVTLEDAATTGAKYKSAVEIIEDTVAALKRNGGGAVSVSIGILRGTRSDYVYEYTDLLIQAILDAGFEIVSAQELLSK